MVRRSTLSMHRPWATPGLSHPLAGRTRVGPLPGGVCHEPVFVRADLAPALVARIVMVAGLDTGFVFGAHQRSRDPA